jgi:hypothetical protein
MQRLEVSCAVRPIYGSLGAKGLTCVKLYPEGHGEDFAWDVDFSLCGSDHRGEHKDSDHQRFVLHICQLVRHAHCTSSHLSLLISIRHRNIIIHPSLFPPSISISMQKATVCVFVYIFAFFE